MSPEAGLPAARSDPASLVGRILKGEREAEAELVERYGRGVSVILRRATGGSPLADDLYQEVFLLAVEKIRAGELRDPERLSGFICGLARNLAVDRFRRDARAGASTDSGSGQSVPDPAPSPLAQVLQGENARCVRQTVAELPGERDRQLLYRFYLREEDKERICADLKLTSLQFNRVLHRARERFKQIYQKQFKEREG